MRDRVTLYDACYVALARRIGAGFVTADKKLVRAVGGGTLGVWALDQVE